MLAICIQGQLGARLHLLDETTWLGVDVHQFKR